MYTEMEGDFHRLIPMEETKNAFLEAYNSHSDALFRFCFFRLNDRELAIDVMQDSFTKAWIAASEKCLHINNIKALLYKIAGNLIIDEYRRRGRREPVASLDDLREDGYDPGFSDTESQVDILDGKDAIKLISQIKEPYGEAVFMRYVQDLSLQEIAEITGETENTISVRVHRGISILRKIYNHDNTK
jgi:RNA polymerase sigma-70 factor, ECF subfamily